MPGINLIATIEHFLRFNLNRIFNLFLFPAEQNYGNTFFVIVRETLVDLISISRVVFTDGVLSLQVMCGAFIEHISSELNPAIQEWMRAVAIRHLNEYINNNNTEQSPNTESYIVRSDSESNGSVADNREVVNDLEADNVEFLDAQSDLDDNLTTNNSNNEMDDSSVPLNQVQYELPSVVIGSESWHSSVPSDWVSD